MKAPVTPGELSLTAMRVNEMRLDDREKQKTGPQAVSLNHCSEKITTTALVRSRNESRNRVHLQ
jgi:hypothetical protein